MTEPAVIIVGAGPGGMVLALLLARSGVNVVVLEQAATFAREFRGELLQPGAVRIFDDLGLRDRLLALSGAFPSGVDIQHGRTRKSFDFPQTADVTATTDIAIVPQQQLLEMLAEELAKHQNAELVMGCSVRELLRDDAGGVTGVRAHPRDGTPIEIRAPLVIAYDGRFSAIRKAAGIALHEHRVAFDLLWFSTPIPTGLANRAYVRVSNGQLFAAFASRSERLQVGWLIRKGEYARLRARSFADVLDHIATHVPVELEAAVRDAVSGWSDIALLPAVSQLAERWSQPGLLLLGDAAHPMSPAGGQGINVAIYDAVVAARQLVPAIAAGTPLDDAARAIENERRPSVVATQKIQNRISGFLFVLGPARALELALRFGRGRVVALFRPPLVSRVARRFLWGEPEVRADQGPWQAR